MGDALKKGDDGGEVAIFISFRCSKSSDSLHDNLELRSIQTEKEYKDEIQRVKCYGTCKWLDIHRMSIKVIEGKRRIKEVWSNYNYALLVPMHVFQDLLRNMSSGTERILPTSPTMDIFE